MGIADFSHCQSLFIPPRGGPWIFRQMHYRFCICNAKVRKKFESCKFFGKLFYYTSTSPDSFTTCKFLASQASKAREELAKLDLHLK